MIANTIFSGNLITQDLTLSKTTLLLFHNFLSSITFYLHAYDTPGIVSRGCRECQQYLRVAELVKERMFGKKRI